MRGTNRWPSTVSTVVLGLITFVIVAALETTLFIAIVVTALIGIVQRESTMIKSSVALATCFFAVPFLGQLIVDQLNDDEFEEARLRSRYRSNDKRKGRHHVQGHRHH